MKFEVLADIIFEKLKPKMETNRGLSIFAKNRAKFEGWLKVELCEILSEYSVHVIPEKSTALKKKIDVIFQDWAIQLKTINTNYRYRGVEKKTRPITMNVQGVIDGIGILNSTEFDKKGVMFVVFPAEHGHRFWQEHYQKIGTFSKEIKYASFFFKDDIPGVIYFCLIK